jgi:hypothetical protein
MSLRTERWTPGWAPPWVGSRPGVIGVATPSPVRKVDWRGSVELNTAHRTIVVIDVEGFGRYARTNPNKVRIRRGMYDALEHAFAAAELPWNDCQYSDLGDGVLVLGPAHLPKSPFVDQLPGALADGLAGHNIAHPPAERMRLRLALHAGEVTYDDYGVTGSSILHAQRLLDAPALKHALADSPAVLAVIASSWFFEEVVRQSERSRADTYRPVEVADEDVAAPAWIRLLAARRALMRCRRLRLN